MGRRYVFLAATCTLLLWNAAARAQTFTQLSDMGSSVGPRLTRAVTQQKVQRDVFSSLGKFVSYVEGQTAYEFATDPIWQRVVFGQWDSYIDAFDNALSGPTERLNSRWGGRRHQTLCV